MVKLSYGEYKDIDSLKENSPKFVESILNAGLKIISVQIIDLKVFVYYDNNTKE